MTENVQTGLRLPTPKLELVNTTSTVSTLLERAPQHAYKPWCFLLEAVAVTCRRYDALTSQTVRVQHVRYVCSLYSSRQPSTSSVFLQLPLSHFLRVPGDVRRGWSTSQRTASGKPTTLKYIRVSIQCHHRSYKFTFPLSYLSPYHRHIASITQ